MRNRDCADQQAANEQDAASQVGIELCYQIATGVDNGDNFIKSGRVVFHWLGGWSRT